MVRTKGLVITALALFSIGGLIFAKNNSDKENMEIQEIETSVMPDSTFRYLIEPIETTPEGTVFLRVPEQFKKEAIEVRVKKHDFIKYGPGEGNIYTLTLPVLASKGFPVDTVIPLPIGQAGPCDRKNFFSIQKDNFIKEYR
ncbi:hypothetical protein CO154_00550 [Candidatus Pacearchaeota archaeon CG_4_9_14_3_um_filter_31_7]|nr:MAG: hypothetical protein COU55_02340 [Candidatus Pacearchaeota archaeon CG10_big_fil_rev_8_21_14_0_10_31_59]PIZ80122.1 MAG: hypothetical protein COX99_03080 [Candidatus Pacearchaeota archaeon CG_4_10_14_0_2_um_filter_31_10]PJA70898.1 MAG: hypothetical protein CO154_00550 [Candidatus Pacearchaeota archaeon CG_4_9_14_3_um_filter_31_7]